MIEDVRVVSCYEAGHDSLKKVAKLALLYGVGSVSSRTFVMEFFGWRQFKNRREVGALAGLTPTPYVELRSKKCLTKGTHIVAEIVTWGLLVIRLQYQLF
jgi:hypothetical protein